MRPFSDCVAESNPGCLRGEGIPFGSLDLGYDDMREGGNNARGGRAISSDSDSFSMRIVPVVQTGTWI